MGLRLWHRRSGLAALASWAVCALLACAPPGPPDVLLIVVDTLRADRLGSYGYSHPTPEMDALARESLLFENAFAHAPRTLPSMASLFTSLRPSRHGLSRHGESLPAELPTLAEAFRAAGYETALVSASADVVDPAVGLARGFDTVQVEPPPPGERTPADDPALVRDHAITLRGIQRIIEPRDAPLFLVVHYLGPHPPYDPRKRNKRPGTRLYRGPVDGSLPQLAQASRGEIDLDVLDQTQMSALYDAKVQGVDDQVGDLLGHLRRAGRLDDMLVVLTSDHGEALGGDRGFSHGTTLYQEQLHVPLLLRRPGGEGASRRVSRLVGLVDLGPTLLALAGVPDGREADGRSFAAALVAPSDMPAPDAEPDGVRVVSELPPDAAWAEVWGPERHGAAVTSARWTLLALPESGGFELFDRSADPGQRLDVASQHRDVVESLARELGGGPAPGD